ncbi:MAG: glycosyltransferase family 2 protein [Chloroflexi bacterium]|nr:MAG: glycosyltransferase family 2 protein [Chloroflexota bacterium]
MINNPTLAIQYVNYHTIDYLRSSIADAVADLNGSAIDYKIYILDNASGDDLGEFKHDDIVTVYSDQNVGFGAGHNKLSTIHDSDFTLLLNPDTRILQPNTIKRMIDSLLASPNAVAVGPRLVGQDEQQQAWDHGELDISSRPDSPTSYWEARSEKGAVAWTSGAASLFKTAAFKSVGGFDEKFFLYKEEEDLCLRLRQQGHNIVYDPTISITHIGSVVANKDLPYFEQSISYYNEKHDLR